MARQDAPEIALLRDEGGELVTRFFLHVTPTCIVAKLDIVAVAEGRLVPETYVKIVQPADAGIVREILVNERDHVEPGQPVQKVTSDAGMER